MFEKILIANRGEIAYRIIRTANKMGIKTVAVYSDADHNALFTQLADEAYYLGGPEPSDSYLKVDEIIGIALRSNAEAIHPGYGFLSENPRLPALCDQNGLVFIGPPAGAIHAMGSKSEAKNIMLKANVPLVPGYHGEDQSIEVLTQASTRVGYPQLIKASAGGGGKGMRIVRQADNVEVALLAAQREALSAFGDQKLLIEKYIEQPRHIEVQIFCDQLGNSVYLHDRDCSVQRRHQKIVEEAPAPKLTEDTRKQMGEAAIECAKSIDYVGAGTVEFLLDKDQNFYFMEMNTRLQVEHPVTEMITQQDLVEWQFKVANGDPLPLTQEQIPNIGHSFECRIYAENPDNDFLPSTGTLSYLHQPEESNVVRIDTGVRQGDAISVFYDPMIAKLIVWGDDRLSAARRMNRALNQLHIAGVDTNRDFLNTVITHPSFLDEEITTEFIEKHRTALFKARSINITSLITAAALYIYTIKSRIELNVNTHQNHITAWNILDFWQTNGSQKNHFSLLNNEQNYSFEFSAINEYTFSVGYLGINYNVEYAINGSTITIAINGDRSSFPFFINGHTIQLFHDHCTEIFSIPDVDHDHDEQHPGGSLLAPLQGKIVSIEVEPNTTVEKGRPLLIIEAMKMEHTIVSLEDGIVKSYLCNPNDIVEADQELIEFEPSGGDE